MVRYVDNVLVRKRQVVLVDEEVYGLRRNIIYRQYQSYYNSLLV
jgi:hypothetical protein